VIGDSALLKQVRPQEFVDERFGLPTVTDILKELEKPGRDPRPAFKTATFREGVETLEDLREGMQLEGVVTNVTNFGAFVDVGVHQDGLVHISALADRFVKDPREVVKPGDIVSIRPQSREKEYFKILAEELGHRDVPEWMTRNDDEMSVTILQAPTRDQIVLPEVNEQLIVEFYSK